MLCAVSVLHTPPCLYFVGRCPHRRCSILISPTVANPSASRLYISALQRLHPVQTIPKKPLVRVPTAPRQPGMSNNTSASRLGEFTGGFPPRNRSAERPSNSVTLGQGIGNGANGWREPNNIWSQTFTSRTRESSRTREVGNLLDSAKDMMEGGKGSGSLVASSEVDATVCNPHRWGSAEANRRYLRSTGGSPVRRGSTQFPVGQPFLDNSQGISQFPSQSRASISTSSMRPTNGSFGGLNGQRYNDSLPNGLKPFHRYSDDPVLFQDPLGPWPDALSPYSPTDERRTRSTSEYVGSAPSTAASRNGSLPGSTYENESVQFPNADILAQLGQASTVPRGHNSSFSSQSNGRVGSDRHSSQGSDVAAMLQQFHLNNGSEQSNFPQKSLFGNTNNNLGSQQNPSDYTYPRHLRQDLSLNQDEGRLNGGSLTPDGFPSVQSSDNLNGLHVIGAGDRGVITPNGSEFRHSPYYSTGDTPPATFDPVYSRNDQHRPLANTALLDRKLSRLQQEQQQQQQQQQRFLQAPYQPMLPPQFRHQFSPYASPYGLSNGLSVPPVGPNMPLAPSMQATFIPPGIIANVEPPRAPSIDGISIRSQKLEDFKMNSKNKIFTLRVSSHRPKHFPGYSDQNLCRISPATLSNLAAIRMDHDSSSKSLSRPTATRSRLCLKRFCQMSCNLCRTYSATTLSKNSSNTVTRRRRRCWQTR